MWGFAPMWNSFVLNCDSLQQTAKITNITAVHVLLEAFCFVFLLWVVSLEHFNFTQWFTSFQPCSSVYPIQGGWSLSQVLQGSGTSILGKVAHPGPTCLRRHYQHNLDKQRSCWDDSGTWTGSFLLRCSRSALPGGCPWVVPWTDYISWLVWKHLSVHSDELQEVVGLLCLGCCLVIWPQISGRKWMDGYLNAPTMHMHHMVDFK